MAMVQGEDTESDEEINTEHLQSLVLTPDGSITGYPGIMKGMGSRKTAGIVMGEESETDEEEEEEGGDRDSVDQPDGGGVEQLSDQANQQSDTHNVQDVSKQEPVDTVAPVPQSLLHKKLREKNQSLRKNIVDRILKLYRITSRNLTLVNDNLSKAQGTIETVNSNLKRGEHELSELNSILSDINTDARAVAPNLSVLLPHGTKKSPSPITQKLLMGVPKVYNLLAAGSSRASHFPEEQSEGQAKLKQEAASVTEKAADRHSEGQSATPLIPEAQPGQADP